MTVLAPQHTPESQVTQVGTAEGFKSRECDFSFQVSATQRRASADRRVVGVSTLGEFIAPQPHEPGNRTNSDFFPNILSPFIFLTYPQSHSNRVPTMHERGEQRTVQQNTDWEIKAPLDWMVWLAGCGRSRNGWYGINTQIGLACIGGGAVMCESFVIRQPTNQAFY